MANVLLINPEGCTGCAAVSWRVPSTMKESFVPLCLASRCCVSRQGLPVPLTCLQCDEPSCLKVSARVGPSAVMRATGVVTVDGDKCIGCRLCIKRVPCNINYVKSQAGHQV